jgi:calnexin
MQNDILFDNIYIGHSVEDAKKLKAETFDIKHPVEKQEEEASKPKVEDKPKSPSDMKFMDDPVNYVREKLDLFLTIAKTDPIQAAKFVPEIAGGIGALLVALIAIVISAVSMGGASASPPAKKTAPDAKAAATDTKSKASGATASGAETAKAEVNKRTTRKAE